ncbi:MAG: chemotaxis protein CheB, partial [Blastocatellia bacterium]
MQPRKSDKPVSEPSPESKLVSGPVRKPEVDETPQAEASFPIVGVGASAGGLEAFTQLLSGLPIDSGMAFVMVQHLAPQHESVLTELLSRSTSLPVTEVRDGMIVEPDHIYVIPPNMNMALLHGKLNLMSRAEHPGQHLPIDYFFRSLAADQGSKAIGVVLSGTASDGAQGLAAIKAEGGITFAQDPKTAKYDGMPRSSITAGVVDFVLGPREIALGLVRIGNHPYVAPHRFEKGDYLPPESEHALNKVFIMLRAAYGVDFSFYKPTTIKRRVVRRMVLHRIDSLDGYIKLLQKNRDELDALYQDVLINVTGFFRDSDAFDSRVKIVFPAIVKNHPPDSPIRIWVPGCSTGEEPYSIAIAWVEFMKDSGDGSQVQIFATDVSDPAIEKARGGIYPEGISADVSPERLRRFFIKADGGYRINKSIRDNCIFARQDVTKDPPFSKLDLISCRNLLIYLSSVIQKKIIPIFHYAMNPWGFLLLGSSETIGPFADLYSLVDKKQKIYRRKATGNRVAAVDFVARGYSPER